MIQPAFFGLARLLILVPLLAFASQGHSMELPEGMKVTVIAEYPSDASGLETVRLIKVVLQAGTGWTKIKQAREEYCNIEQGTLTSTDHTLNATNVYSVGSWWAPRKDHVYTTFNTGDVEVVMWAYQLIEKENSTDGKKVE